MCCAAHRGSPLHHRAVTLASGASARWHNRDDRHRFGLTAVQAPRGVETTPRLRAARAARRDTERLEVMVAQCSRSINIAIPPCCCGRGGSSHRQVNIDALGRCALVTPVGTCRSLSARLLYFALIIHLRPACVCEPCLLLIPLPCPCPRPWGECLSLCARLIDSFRGGGDGGGELGDLLIFR